MLLKLAPEIDEPFFLVYGGIVPGRFAEEMTMALFGHVHITHAHGHG